MTQPGNKEDSELGPNGNSHRRPRKRTHRKKFQTKTREDFANNPNGSLARRGESMERSGIAIETATSWQNQSGPSETNPDYSRPRREDQAEYRVEAKAQTQTLPWQDHPGPYGKIPDRSWPHYGEPKKRSPAAEVHMPSWQDHPGPFKNVPDRNRSNQNERKYQNSVVVEKMPRWQDHLGFSETVPSESLPYPENQAGQNPGAVMQRSGGQYDACPNGKGLGHNLPHLGDQRERTCGATLQRRPLKTHPAPFGEISTQRSSSHVKSWERAAQVCLPYRQWTPPVRDQEAHPTAVAPKELQFFNPMWAPYSPAQDTVTATTHQVQIVSPSNRRKTAHEAIQAHLGITNGRSRRQNSSNERKETSQPVVEECGRKRPRVSIPRRQCYSESKPDTLFHNGIPSLEPVTSTYKNGHNSTGQEDNDIPTVCLPGKDCYGDQLPDYSG